jgi:hypothetical protein
MEPSERETLDLLVAVLKEELDAQFGVERAHATDEERLAFARLLADGVWDSFSLVRR